jgi:Rrf2 family protein
VQLTKKSSYGLIAALELAGEAAGEPLSASAIAGRYSLSHSFVEKILHQLKLAGIVSSTQGRKGGYRLARSPHRITVRHVLEALGESLDLVG